MTIGNLDKMIDIPEHEPQPGPMSAPPSYLSPVLIEWGHDRMVEGALTHPGDPWLTTGVPVCKGGVGTKAIWASTMRHAHRFELACQLERQGEDCEDIETAIDHLAGMFCRLNQLAHVLHEIRAGRLPKSLDDMANQRRMAVTDKQRIDWLEDQNNKAQYTGKCVFRWSEASRGWWLHETSWEGFSTVREAIDAAMFYGLRPYEGG